MKAAVSGSVGELTHEARLILSFGRDGGAAVAVVAAAAVAVAAALLLLPRMQ